MARIEGDFFNVMGFPVQRFLQLIGRFGWSYGFGVLVPGPSGAMNADPEREL